VRAALDSQVEMLAVYADTDVLREALQPTLHPG
jgi:hypothetical protein